MNLPASGMSLWRKQVLSIMRLELGKSFFSRRGLWVYLLALGPVAIYGLHALVVLQSTATYQTYAKRNPVTRAQLEEIEEGMPETEVIARLGEPPESYNLKFEASGRTVMQYSDGDVLLTVIVGLRRPADFPFPGGPFGPGKGKGRGAQPDDSDGDVDSDGDLSSEDTGEAVLEEESQTEERVVLVTEFTGSHSLNQDSVIFATVFQYFFLPLAVFFGCVGVFTNLFRGEMLDKSLHFYLLAPVRREVLMAGKYIAGLLATAVIFTTSTALQIAVMAAHQDSVALDRYLAGNGWSHAAAYLGVTVLACVGYGSVFLLAGLVFRNPILPAAVVLVWEGMNIFLPATLKKISVIFYLQSLSPVVASPDDNLPAVLRTLITDAEPTPAWIAITGLLVVTGAILVIGASRARRLEINYGAE